MRLCNWQNVIINHSVSSWVFYVCGAGRKVLKLYFQVYNFSNSKKNEIISNRVSLTLKPLPVLIVTPVDCFEGDRGK